MDIYFWVMIGCSVASFWAVFRYCDIRVRTPFFVYTISYIVTTVLGATYIGLTDAGPLWRLFDLTIDVSPITQTKGFLYWFLLYGPLFVPTLVLLGCSRRRYVATASHGSRQRPQITVDAFSFTVVLSVISVFCLGELARHNGLTNISASLASSGDYQSLITARSSMMTQLSGHFYGFVYVGFPALSVIALFQWRRMRNTLWCGLFGISVVAVVYFTLATVQKSPLFVYMLGIFLALVTIGALRIWVIPVIAGTGMLVLTALQTVFLGDWSTLQSLSLIIFRMASSYPFFVNLYPKHIPYLPLNFGFGLLGWGTTLDMNIRVFDYMYPDIFWVQGHAAAPAHICAFAQGGIAPALLVMLLIGGAIVFVGRLRSRVANSPVLFGVYIQGLIALYFLTQVSLRGALLESYGLLYAVLPVAALMGVRGVIVLAVARIREHLTTNTSLVRTV
ncbi:MAG: hypothetical protein JOZ62_13475 [Acidobacteriaceae bacterium]|nr:hypothetical protein [Acidobacteriaceae bacterium]